ncbi:unnamed protein product [Lactuca saligna]|uniref:Uncharacterized protein n=1 Tax=Lactuca saligna TaxID=75948 RepID=A0AA35Y8U0_LACSI|nr:unnamed protein product [Lactuca saligna]
MVGSTGVRGGGSGGGGGGYCAGMVAEEKGTGGTVKIDHNLKSIVPQSIQYAVITVSFVLGFLRSYSPSSFYPGHSWLQLLHRKYNGNFLVNMLGKWKEFEYFEQSIPVGGLAYYVTAPSQGND